MGKRVKRVFVVGAGASAPYGLPIGRGLREEILGLAEGVDLERGGPAVLGRLSSQLKPFQKQFRESRRWSVDAFLANNTQYMEIGKGCLCVALRRKQHDAKMDVEEGNWLDRIFNRLMPDPKWHQRHDITFVTFNYDLLLEKYFQVAFEKAFSLSFEQAAEMRAKLRILHVHGTLGEYRNTTFEEREFESVADLRMAIDGMHIVHENKGERNVLARCRRAISSADVLAFLGFGYDQGNIAKVVPRAFRKRKRFYGGTRMGLEDGELPGMSRSVYREGSKQVADFGQDFKWGDMRDDCEMFLRKHPVLV